MGDVEVFLTDVVVDIPDIPDAVLLAPFIERYFMDLIRIDKIRVSHHKVDLMVQDLSIQDKELHLQSEIQLRPDDKRLRKLRSIYTK